MTPDLYLGIDQSYTGFGLTALSGTGEHTTVLGRFDLKTYDGDHIGRLLAIEDWLAITISRQPTAVAIEGYASGSTYGREQAGELGWAVKRTIFERYGVRPVIVQPTLVKKYATGSGAARKAEIILAVYKRWGVEFHDDNLADSYVLAHIAHDWAHDWDGNPLDLPKFQQDVISKLAV